MPPQLGTKTTELCNLSRSFWVLHIQARSTLQGTRSGKLKSITKPPKIKKLKPPAAATNTLRRSFWKTRLLLAPRITQTLHLGAQTNPQKQNYCCQWPNNGSTHTNFCLPFALRRNLQWNKRGGLPAPRYRHAWLLCFPVRLASGAWAASVSIFWW